MSKLDTSKYDQRGFTAEDFIIEHFVDNGEKLVKSSFEDDIKRDIDAYHTRLGNVSIKSQGSKYFNFAVEFKIVAYASYDKATKTHSSSIDGWWGTSEADTYIIGIRDDNNNGKITKAYLLDKKRLVKYIEDNPVRETWCTYAMGNNRGRYHNLPFVWLYNLKKLMDANVIYDTVTFDTEK